MAEKFTAADLASAVIETAMTAGNPFSLASGSLVRFKLNEGGYIKVADDKLAHELCTDLDDGLNKDANFYTKAVKNIRLRVPRISTPDGCPQAALFGGKPIKGANAAVKNWISFRNGLLRVSKFLDGKRGFTRPNRRFYSSSIRPLSFDPTAVCPTWDRCLHDWLDDDSILLLQELFGYLLVYDSRFEKFAVFYGPKRTGKSTVLKVIERMLGDHNVANLGLERFGGNFGLDEMIDVLVNICADVGPITKVAEGIIKAVVSRDRLSIDRKHRTAIKCEPSARLIFAANEWMKVKDTSGAILDRMLVVAFDRTIAEEDRDRDLADKLTSELPGIVNWSLKGLRRLYATGAFTIPQRMIEEIDQLRYAANPAREFCEEFIETCESGQVPIRDIYQSYCRWANDQGLVGRDILELGRFCRTLKTCFPAVEKRKHSVGDAWVNFYHGIELLRHESRLSNYRS